MRYLVLSDIHSNLEALEAVLADAPDFDAVLSLGDLVDYGPNPNEVVDRVRALQNLLSIAGNHDLGVLGALDLDLFNSLAHQSALWTRRQLRPDVREYLQTLPTTAESPHAFLAHASPRDPIWEYMDGGGLGPPNFRAFEGPLALVGHTHVPRVIADRPGMPVSSMREPSHGEMTSLSEGRLIANPGGVGQPRDGDPRAAYAIFEPNLGEIVFRRVPYEIERTQAKMREANLPRQLAERLTYGM